MYIYTYMSRIYRKSIYTYVQMYIYLHIIFKALVIGIHSQAQNISELLL